MRTIGFEAASWPLKTRRGIAVFDLGLVFMFEDKRKNSNIHPLTLIEEWTKKAGELCLES